MKPARGAKKWLSVAALSAGLREEYAIERWPGRYMVTLAFVPDAPSHAFTVTYTQVTKSGITVESRTVRFFSLDDARAFYTREVRRAKG